MNTPADPRQPAAAACLRVEPLGRDFSVGDGQSLMEAVRSGGYALRSSCRNGTCRECMAQLIYGAVRYRIEWPGLSADEKAEGWVLPCVALAGTARLTLLQPLISAVRPTS